MTFRTRPGRVARAALTAIAALGLVAAAPAVSQAATMTTLFASPAGSGTACSEAAPCSLTQAQTAVRALTGSMTGDVVVRLAGGVYRLAAPLSLGAADSGTGGYRVIWQAAPGATPVLSGGRQVTGWSVYDSANNVYAAAVPAGADSRQLYVDGTLAPRAAIGINRSDVRFTTTGMTIVNSALNYLATLPAQNRIELESQNSFTDRFAPVQSISGTTITMQQPAWNNNNWGYDTLASPFAGGGLQLQNSYSFLKKAGQWYLDPQAGQLYYKAPAGWNPASHDVELPRLSSLLQVSGSYSAPAHDITVQGVTFSHSTWLTPSSNIGYADQQSGTFLGQTYQQPSNFLTSCQSGCQLFEATRNSWRQAPAAVQVSAASNITFAGDSFAHLGQVALGIGNDANANASGVGLGASGITVTGSSFTDDSGAGIVVGGVQPDAHHPTNPAMTNQNITITDNVISGVAKDYKDMAGILSTYVTHAVIEHNEVSALPYDGIDVGWGWGMNDPGGSPDYSARGTYNYQPIYSTATTLKNTVVAGNRIHGTKTLFHDGGSLYNLSANPGSTFSGNYIYDNQRTVGLYLDEGSRYVTLTNNVVQDSGVWAFTNAYSNNHTDGNAFNYNWYNGGVTNVATGAPHYNTLTGNVQVSGTNWPAAAQQVISQSGPRRAVVTVANPGNQSGPAGTAITALQIRATASTAGQSLTYAATGLPAGLSISSSGLITGTPTTAGTSSVTVSATDTSGATGSASFTWTVSGTGSSGGTCRVTYEKNEWSGGFTANVTVANTGTAAVNGWSLAWTFPGDQKITSGWNATVTQAGSAVTATNASYNATIAPGGSAQFGFQGTWTASDAVPTAFTLNGATCG
ncbi:RICIN domain-containing protein [Paractinoplanes ferrugineus]|uniref:CBM2 domain-containing protein n=1 Tax=Paractinoplanes ferrugineus TaxID=113564 RepID=A0A919MHR5_9ACTN|nr:cellulose binding domain-containing protein [Actinoplanes ferrugineus]GIE15229.1 hypothetical protein Afe05nite_70690 [Actinoplanes ferrugineus]